MSTSTHDDWLGPVDHLVVHISDPAASTAGFVSLRSLVDSGAVRVLDLEVLRRTASGIEALDVGSWGDGAGIDLHSLDQTFSGLLDDADRALAVDGLAEDGVAVVVVYESTALRPVVEAWSGAGAQVRSEGPVDVNDITAAAGAADEHRASTAGLSATTEGAQS